MTALFTMAEVEAYFAEDSNQAQFAIDYARRDQLRKKYSKTAQVRNTRALEAGAVTAGQRNKVVERATRRRANAAAGLGPSGQRRGYFRTRKGKKTFVRGGNVLTTRSKKGVISKRVVDSGSKGLRGGLRDLYGRGTKLAGSNRIGQRVVETGYRGASHVLSRGGRYGAAAAGLAAVGGGAYYLNNRD